MNTVVSLRSNNVSFVPIPEGIYMELMVVGTSTDGFTAA
jgi:hypothetical protein